MKKLTLILAMLVLASIVLLPFLWTTATSLAATTSRQATPAPW